MARVRIVVIIVSLGAGGDVPVTLQLLKDEESELPPPAVLIPSHALITTTT